MNKTFTCKELGGVCEQKFTGATLMEIIQKGMPHMMSDEAHKASIMGVENRTGENQEQWMARMQKVFDGKVSE